MEAKDQNSLEVIVLPELFHLLEPTHNARFMALSRLLVRYRNWEY